jgi:hypothetical protein
MKQNEIHSVCFYIDVKWPYLGLIEINQVVSEEKHTQ